MGEERRPGRFKVKFTPEEDDRLRSIVEQYGPKDWSGVASQMPNRDSRQCRERWMNYVNPALIHVPWTPEEEHLLESKFQEYGAQWQVIALFFPLRSRNQIKSHWHTRHKTSLGPPFAPPPPPQPADPKSQDLCQIPMSNPFLCNDIFSEPREESIWWANTFTGFF
jgi:hypothetical protein